MDRTRWSAGTAWVWCCHASWICVGSVNTLPHHSALSLLKIFMIEITLLANKVELYFLYSSETELSYIYLLLPCMQYHVSTLCFDWTKCIMRMNFGLLPCFVIQYLQQCHNSLLTCGIDLYFHTSVFTWICIWTISSLNISIWSNTHICLNETCWCMPQIFNIELSIW